MVSYSMNIDSDIFHTCSIYTSTVQRRLVYDESQYMKAEAYDLEACNLQLFSLEQSCWF